MLVDLHFGRRFEIGLPGEWGGTLRDKRKWYPLDVATAAFGHQVAVTGLQLAVAYQALANDGVLLKPKLFVDASAAGSRRVMSVDASRNVRAMLKTVVADGGTGARAQVSGFSVAGKTGTSRKIDPVAGGYSRDRHFVTFAGMLPAKRPRFVLVVMVDEPGIANPSGGSVAAPAFAEIAQATAQILALEPNEAASSSHSALATAKKVAAEFAADVQINKAPSEVRDRSQITGVLPSFLGLTAKEAVERSHALPMLEGLAMVGSGRVTSQSPAAGRPLSELGTLNLRLGAE